MTTRAVTRAEVLALRWRTNGLFGRVPWSPDALAAAAHGGLTDSMPRAAVLSLAARVHEVDEDVLAHPRLVQVWGPRFSVYAVAAEDRPVFTLGRHPRARRGDERARDVGARLRAAIGDEEVLQRDAAAAAGLAHPNAVRYATTTGTVLVRWDGAREPTIRVVDPPDVEVDAARAELARRHLHVAGPSTVPRFAAWAGVNQSDARATLALLGDEVVEVATPVGPELLLAADLPLLDATDRPRGVHLLPSGDAFWLHHDEGRDLLVADPDRRDELWTSRVWPGALLVDGELVGTWRRAGTAMTVTPWRPLADAVRDEVARTAAALPLPVDGDVEVTWADR